MPGHSRRHVVLTLLFVYTLMVSAVATAQTASAEGELIARARQSALRYSAQLPNFICKQVTRRSFDRKGDGYWREVDELSQFVTFYEGREHYEQLSEHKLARENDLFQPWMNSTGEFGSLLQQIFTPEAATRFSSLGSDRIRGRHVQTFSYEVDLKHTKYEIHWREGGNPMHVVDAYQGLISIDPDRLAVLRLTLTIQPLPAPFPVRNESLTLEYGDAVVGGEAYNLPLWFNMVVQLQKGSRLRNDVTFSGYQRFAANSRLLPDHNQ